MLAFQFQFLLFAVSGDISSQTRVNVLEFVNKLRDAHKWAIEAPEFVCSTDDDIESLGFVLQIYAAEMGGDLPRELDLKSLSDVLYVVDQWEEFSKIHSLEIEIELEGEVIGCIQNGVSDQSLKEDFIGEWQKFLQT